MSTQPQLPLDHKAATIRREIGMDRVAAKAQRVAPGWMDHAFVLLQRYAAQQRTPFLGEQFRAWAHARGLARPHDDRAFGPLMTRAAKAGVIVRAGFAPSASSNGSAKPLWQAPMQGRAA